MQLHAQEFVDILNCFQRGGPDRTAREKRSAVRYDIRAPIQVLSVPHEPGATPFKIYLRDISMGGMGLFQGRPIKSGQQFVAFLPRSKQPPLLVICTARFAGAIADGLYSVGAEFSSLVEKTDPNRAQVEAALKISGSI